MTSHRWKRFFTEAGLPSEVSDNYAIIFTDNRIRFDMLDELSKEYLSEMGIKKMGDIISILRHAKTVHSNFYREKVFANKEELGQSPGNMAKTINQADSTEKTPKINPKVIGRVDQISTVRIVKMPIKNTNDIEMSNVKPQNVSITSRLSRNVTGLESNTIVSRKRIEPPNDDPLIVVRPAKQFRLIGSPEERTIVRNRKDNQKRYTNFRKEIKKALASNIDTNNPEPLPPTRVRADKPFLIAVKNDTRTELNNKKSIQDRLGRKTVFERLSNPALTSSSSFPAASAPGSVFNRLGTK